jgi:hypothetical protein
MVIAGGGRPVRNHGAIRCFGKQDAPGCGK